MSRAMDDIPENLYVVYERGVLVGAFKFLDSARTIVAKRLKAGKPRSVIWRFEKSCEIQQPERGEGDGS